jgi:hypothetical protein
MLAVESAIANLYGPQQQMTIVWVGQVRAALQNLRQAMREWRKLAPPLRLPGEDDQSVRADAFSGLTLALTSLAKPILRAARQVRQLENLHPYADARRLQRTTRALRRAAGMSHRESANVELRREAFTIAKGKHHEKWGGRWPSGDEPIKASEDDLLRIFEEEAALRLKQLPSRTKAVKTSVRRSRKPKDGDKG